MDGRRQQEPPNALTSWRHELGERAAVLAWGEIRNRRAVRHGVQPQRADAIMDRAQHRRAMRPLRHVGCHLLRLRPRVREGHRAERRTLLDMAAQLAQQANRLAVEHRRRLLLLLEGEAHQQRAGAGQPETCPPGRVVPFCGERARQIEDPLLEVDRRLASQRLITHRILRDASIVLAREDDLAGLQAKIRIGLREAPPHADIGEQGAEVGQVVAGARELIQIDQLGTTIVRVEHDVARMQIAVRHAQLARLERRRAARDDAEVVFELAVPRVVDRELLRGALQPGHVGDAAQQLRLDRRDVEPRDVRARQRRARNGGLAEERERTATHRRRHLLQRPAMLLGEPSLIEPLQHGRERLIVGEVLHRQVIGLRLARLVDLRVGGLAHEVLAE